MSPEISVIVPVYNVEKYLAECVDSILEQTFRNFELILIDDGSKDKSGEICDNYARKDKRIRVIHKTNGGVSTARNEGLKEARGTYIIFVDSDDYLDKECLFVLYHAIEKSDSIDCALCGIRFVYKDPHKDSEYILPEATIQNADDFNRYYSLLRNNFGLYANCAKIYRMSLIRRNNIIFNENMSIYEDGLFVTNYLDHCKMISCTNKVMYNYRQYDSMSLMKQYNANAATALQAKFDGESFRRSILNNENLLSYYKDFFEAWVTQATQIYSRYCGSGAEKRIKLENLYELKCLEITLSKVDPRKLGKMQTLVYVLLKIHQIHMLHLLFELMYGEKNGKQK